MTGKGNGMSQREYWASLSRSFDRRFIDKAHREFDPRIRPQAHRSCENGIKKYRKRDNGARRRAYTTKKGEP